MVRLFEINKQCKNGLSFWQSIFYRCKIINCGLVLSIKNVNNRILEMEKYSRNKVIEM